MTDSTDMALSSASILWRGIQPPGHEVCRLYADEHYWYLDGTAAFSHEQLPCLLTYHIVCNKEWITVSASVEGWVGQRGIDIELKTDLHQQWWLNEGVVPNVSGSTELDLNFSPSTNTIAIRRLKLEIGEEKEITAAWLRFPSFTLEPLPQTYQRLEKNLYRYTSSGGSFVADLRTDANGFVVDYPGIWISEATLAG